jgi:ABC-type branched-subunit amino acid transport system ATPase component
MIAIFLATFSGGEQQMLAIARGIMSDPEVFIIDELSLWIGPPLSCNSSRARWKL